MGATLRLNQSLFPWKRKKGYQYQIKFSKLVLHGRNEWNQTVCTFSKQPTQFTGRVQQQRGKSHRLFLTPLGRQEIWVNQWGKKGPCIYFLLKVGRFVSFSNVFFSLSSNQRHLGILKSFVQFSKINIKNMSFIILRKTVCHQGQVVVNTM